MAGLSEAFEMLGHRLIGVVPLRTLTRRGLVVGRDFQPMLGVTIDPDHCWLVTIGDDVTLSRDVLVLAHDASMKRGLGATRVARVTIGDRVFVGARCVILPGVSIGSDAVIGAGSVVATDIPAGSVAAGNPARVIAATAEWLERKAAERDEAPAFGREYTLAGAITPQRRAEMLERIGEGSGYVR